MSTAKIAVSLDPEALKEVNRLVEHSAFPSRSQLIQDALAEKLEKIRHIHLASECTKLNKDAESEEVLYAISSANELSREGITYNKLLSQVKDRLLPWFAEEVRLRSQASEREQIEQMKSDRNAPVYIEAPINGEAMVSRSRSCVLVGPPELVQKALDRIQEVVLRLRAASGMVNVTMRLLGHDLERVNVTKLANRGRALTEVPLSRWKDACKSQRNLDKTLTPWLRTTHRNRVDVTIIHDLSEMLPEPVAGFSRTARALRAHRLVRSWANTLLSAVVTGLPGTFARDDEHLHSLEVFADIGWLTEEAGVLQVNDRPWMFQELPEFQQEDEATDELED